MLSCENRGYDYLLPFVTQSDSVFLWHPEFFFLFLSSFLYLSFPETWGFEFASEPRCLFILFLLLFERGHGQDLNLSLTFMDCQISLMMI